MKKSLIILIACCALFAVLFQFYLMYQNRTQSVPETIIRFFSFFTILTNSLVAVYFSKLSAEIIFQKSEAKINFEVLTAITVYILIVGLVYQVLLRHLWSPTGLQRVVDEMLHSLNPLLVLIFWIMNRKGNNLQYKSLLKWLIFPLAYLVFVLIRGEISGFYPYPFINVTEIGFQQVIINSLGMTAAFVLISTLLIRFSKRKTNSSVVN